MSSSSSEFVGDLETEENSSIEERIFNLIYTCILRSRSQMASFALTC